jgi:hypothetical protein
MNVLVAVAAASVTEDRGFESLLCALQNVFLILHYYCVD